MSIESDYEKYKDGEYGLISHAPQTVSGNGNLYTAQALVAFSQNNALINEKQAHYRKLLKKNEREPGLLMRTPQNEFGVISPDELFGAALASRHLDNGLLAQRILEYGKNKPADELGKEDKRPKLSKWVWRILSLCGLRGIPYVYNNINPRKFNLSAWMGRQIPLIAALKLVGHKESPNLLEKIILAISLNTDPSKSNPGHACLKWSAIKAVEGKNWIVDLGAESGKEKLMGLWESPNEMFADYFNDSEHPTAKWLQGW